MSEKPRLKILGQPDPDVPGDIHLVGRYAIGVTWADGHGSIYPFEVLRRDCPCGSCGALEAAAGAAGWPQEIKRTPEGLRVVWADGHPSHYPYAGLRASCRCAGCTGGH